MEELLLFLIVASVLLGVVTLIGHGIWVALAWFFKQFMSQPRPASRQTLEACPRCWSTLLDGSKHCRVCSWPFAATSTSSRPALQAHLRRQLARQEALGAIDSKTYRELTASIESLLIDAEPSVGAAVTPAAVDDLEEVEIVEAEMVASPNAGDSLETNLSEQVAAQPSAEPPVDVGERARRYAAARQAEAEQPVELSQPAQPVHREALSRVLSAFMEEKNIRWGELVGGLLIVGCSIALVISFWAEIAERPLLKFVIFSGVSTALFGAGFYTLHRWQIHTTSRGLLTIATLLVPLNFLAIAAFTREAPPTDAASIGGELFSLGLFAALCYLAARSILPSGPVLLTIGVIFTSLVQLITRRFADADAALPTVYGLALLSVGCLVIVTGWYLVRVYRNRIEDETLAGQLFLMLGVVSFAAALPFGLLVYERGAIVETLSHLSPLVTLFGLPALATGLLFWRGTLKHAAAVEQTIGIGVGVAGAVVMAWAIVLAWPDPGLLLPTAITTAVLFAVLAVLFRIPAAHLVSCGCLFVAWLVGFHVARGELAWMLNSQWEVIQVLLTAASGNALAPLAALFAAAAIGMGYLGRKADAGWILAAAAATVAASLLLIGVYGFARAGDPFHVTWTLIFYALAAAVATWKTQRGTVSWNASLLLLAAIVQGVVFRYAEAWQLEHAWVTALLLHASLVGVAGVAARRRGPLADWIVALYWSSMATSTAAAVLLVASFPQIDRFTLAGYLAWIAAVWLVLSIAAGWRSVFAAFQLTLYLSIASALTGLVESRPWWAASRYPWLDPWFWQIQGIALAVYCSLWTAIRLLARRIARPVRDDPRGPLQPLARLINADSVAIDRMLEVAACLLLAVVAIYGVAPGVAQELAVTESGARVVPALSEFELWGAPHSHAFDGGGWLMLLSIAAMVAIGMWYDSVRSRSVALLLLGGAACLMLAARWETDTSTASALRWTLGGYAIVASAPAWGRLWCRSLAWRIGILSDQNTRHAPSPALDALARATIITFVLACYGAMGLYVAVGAVAQAGVPSQIATLLYWLLAACLLSLVIALPLAAQQRTMQSHHGAGATWPRLAGLLWQTLLMMGVAPLAAVCIYIVAEALKQNPIVGPPPGSWFATVGLSVSYGVPLAALIVALLGHAARQRSAGYALSAALLVNLLATIVYLFELARAARPLDVSAWIELAQINSIVAAMYSLAWLGILWRWGAKRNEVDEQASQAAAPATLLASYVAFGAALCGVTIVWGVAYLSLFPATPARIEPAGNWVGWLALLLNVIAVMWLSGRAEVRHTITVLAASIGVLAAMIALASVAWDNGDWLAYHTLLAGLIVAAYLAPVLPRVLVKSSTLPAARGAGVAISTGWAVLAVLLSLRALGGDPWSPWWTVGGLAVIAALAAGLAWYVARRAFVWAAAILLNLAASIWWIDVGHQMLPAGDLWSEFLYLNVFVLAMASIYSVAIERRCARTASRRGGLALHPVAIWGMIVVTWVAVLSGLAMDLAGFPGQNTELIAAAALIALLAAVLARYWDPRRRPFIGSLYLVGGLAPAMLLDALNITDPSQWLWAATLFASAYALASSYAWSRRGELAGLAVPLRMPLSTEPQSDPAASGDPLALGQAWLTVGTGLIAVGATVSVAWIECTYAAWTERNTAAYALLGLAVAWALLSRGRLRSPLQYTALVYGVLFAVGWGLSWLPPDAAGALLNRTIVAVVALAVMIPLYGLGLVKIAPRDNDWTRAGQRLATGLVLVGAVAVTFVIGCEVWYYLTDEHVPIGWPARTAVALALAGLALAALAAAVVPGRDPLGLSDRGKTSYVYAAEIIAAMAFIHVRVTMPWLFSGFFTRMWPLIAMGIAFLGVGFSEYCRRRKQPVLSQPLERSAALIPLLPLLGFWVVPSEANYALVLLTVGALYAVLAVLRKSLLFSILAVLAANASLWRLLYTQEGLSLTEHPQLWLIPPAICVLIASYLNRQRLNSQQTTAVRYLSAIVIYAASTADIFLNGVAEAPWLPGVLAGLSLLGIFAGIVLRVRAFLFLGTTFLVVSLLTVIWYAAVELDRTWIWWVSGIVTGVLIIALFGLFEKKRDEVLRIVENLKQWES